MSSRKQPASPRTAAPLKVGGEQIGKRNLNDITYRTIKDDIISRALPPGEDVSEGVLAARYGNRIPGRAAGLRRGYRSSIPRDPP